MRARLFAALPLLAGLLGGCASGGPDTWLAGSGDDAADRPFGTIIVSVSTNGTDEAQLRFRRFGETTLRTLSSKSAALLDAPTFEAGGDRGRVHVLELPPGRYELVDWALRLGRQPHHRRWLRPAGLPPIEFALAAGEAVYLGNLHIAVRREGDDGGLPIDLQPVGAATARLRPRAERDLAFAAEQVPAVQSLPLRPVVRPAPGWSLTVERPQR